MSDTLLDLEKYKEMMQNGDECVIISHAGKEKELPVEKPFTPPEVLFTKLMKIMREYLPDDDLSSVEAAYRFADQKHNGQLRKSGEPYIVHPLCVALILAELQMDVHTIVGGILHDVVEDTDTSLADINDMFGNEVAILVDGVTKLTQTNYNQDKIELQAENLRKMVLAMAKDIRVVIIKLADRLHNLRTLQYQKPEKQQEKARETMDIYAPLAQRLGISKIKIELDDLSLQYLEPEVYADLEEKIKLRTEEREAFISDIIRDVSNHLKEAGISAVVTGRVKHFFSIYKKMKTQNKTIDQIYDLFAVRIMVTDVKDCYASLGIIHDMYKPIPGRIKDYIAMPKPNKYQSLHTTLIGPNGTPFEIQIRTFEMHRIAEYGIAAHWVYKEKQMGEQPVLKEQEKMAWLRQILELHQDMTDSSEFLKGMKDDLSLLSENVYCFTPTGDVKNLPAGSTPIDFAYMVHSAVGNKMVGARVNGQLVPIDYVLQTGDRVDIITSQNSKGPSRDWLNVVKSTQAKNKIAQWFKNESKEDNIARGRDLILANCKTKNITPSDILKPEFKEICQHKYGLRDWDSVLSAIGNGALKEGQVVNRMYEEYKKKLRSEMTDEQMLEEIEENSSKKNDDITPKKAGIIVQGLDDVSAHLSKCCSPVPGDEIVGFVTRGRGVSIHRTDCTNVIHASEDERRRFITAEWSRATKSDELYYAEIIIYANNRKGMILDISKVLTEKQIDIVDLNSRVSKQGTATVSVGFRIKSAEELHHIISKIRQIEGVIDIERTSS